VLNVALYAVSCTSATACIAVGSYDFGIMRPFVAHLTRPSPEPPTDDHSIPGSEWASAVTPSATVAQPSPTRLVGGEHDHPGRAQSRGFTESALRQRRVKH